MTPPPAELLPRIAAALDADPFADPVIVCGIALPRADARRFERELISAPLGVAPAGSAQPHPGHTPTPAVALSATTLPEGARAPNREALSGSLFNHLHG